MRVASLSVLGLILTGLSLGCGGKSDPTSAPGSTQGEPTAATPTGGAAGLDGRYLLIKQEFGPIKMTAEELAKYPAPRGSR